MITTIYLFNHFRILNFDLSLHDVEKEIHAFKKKGLIMEEIENNVRNLSKITVNLEAASNELEVRETALL